MPNLHPKTRGDGPRPLASLLRTGAAVKGPDGLLLRSPRTGKRVLVCALTDLDGTANDEHAVERDRLATIQPARKAFAILAQSGIVTGICTARSTGEALHYRRQLGITGPLISENGAVIRFADGSQTVLGELQLLREAVGRISRLLGRTVPNSLDYAGLVAAWEQELRGHGPTLLGHPDAIALRRAADRRGSCFLVGLSPQEKEAVTALAGEMGLTCFGELLHLIPPGVDKGKAFQALHDHLLGLPAESGGCPETVAQIVFGNGENDLPLFRQALRAGGCAVLVGDATSPTGFYFDTSRLRVPRGTIALKGLSHGHAILQSLPRLKAFFARRYGVLFPW